MRIAYGLVRDKTGRPRIDDPATLHPVQIAMLTPEERAELGIWPGAFARDAQGTKRLTHLGNNQYRAEDTLVAVSEVFDGLTHYRLTARVDVAAGGTLTIN